MCPSLARGITSSLSNSRNCGDETALWAISLSLSLITALTLAVSLNTTYYETIESLVISFGVSRTLGF